MSDAPSSVSTAGGSGSGLKRYLVGCLIGCGALGLLVVGSCVGFAIWIRQPGELLEPRRLVGADTTGYLEWTLRLEDPGTARLVEETLDQLNRLQGNRPTIPILDAWNQRRNERNMRQMFPVVAAWSMRPSGTTEEPDHLLSFSMEKLGNRIVLVDWFLGLILSRQGDVAVVRHRGEKIYVPRDGEVAFFLRRSDFFLTSDLETARRAVERLEPSRSADPGGAGAVERLLETLPSDRRLLGAVTNSGGELERIFDWLDLDRRPELDRIDFDPVNGLALSGGFTESASFEVELELLSDDRRWIEGHAEPLARILADVVGGSELPVEAIGSAEAGRLVVRLKIEDLPGLLEEKLRFVQGQ